MALRTDASIPSQGLEIRHLKPSIVFEVPSGEVIIHDPPDRFEELNASDVIDVAVSLVRAIFGGGDDGGGGTTTTTTVKITTTTTSEGTKTETSVESKTETK